MGSGPLIPKLRRSPVAGAILDGIVVGSLALMAVVAWQLGRAAIVDWLTASDLRWDVVAEHAGLGRPLAAHFEAIYSIALQYRLMASVQHNPSTC